LQAFQLIREQRDQNKQELAYHARPFVLCGIPLRRPPHGQTAHARRNGRFFLEITAHPRVRLPYGQDRLIPIWVATLALKQKSRVVQGFRRQCEIGAGLQPAELQVPEKKTEVNRKMELA